MAIKTRNTLKGLFAAGTAATQSKFDDLFDSHFNKGEDSILNGPVGLTGQNGLLGPSGATFYNGLLGPSGATFQTGLWLRTGVTGPTASYSAGTTGEVILDGTAAYIHTGTVWFKITGATSVF